MHAFTGGIPRLINLLCDRALLAAYSERAQRVTPEMVHRGAGKPRSRARRGSSMFSVGARAGGAAVLSMSLLFDSLRRHRGAMTAKPAQPDRRPAPMRSSATLGYRTRRRTEPRARAPAGLGRGDRGGGGCVVGWSAWSRPAQCSGGDPSRPNGRRAGLRRSQHRRPRTAAPAATVDPRRAGHPLAGRSCTRRSASLRTAPAKPSTAPVTPSRVQSLSERRACVAAALAEARHSASTRSSRQAPRGRSRHQASAELFKMALYYHRAGDLRRGGRQLSRAAGAQRARSAGPQQPRPAATATRACTRKRCASSSGR